MSWAKSTAHSITDGASLSELGDSAGWFIGTEGWRACSGRHFLCSCKESNQRKHAPGGAPLRGAWRRWEFSEGTSMCLPETPRIVRGAPRGCTHRRHRALKGTQLPKARAKATARTPSSLKEVLLSSAPIFFSRSAAKKRPQRWRQSVVASSTRAILPLTSHTAVESKKGGQEGIAFASAFDGSLLSRNTP